MSDWQWFTDFSRDAKQRGDAVPARLLELHAQGFQVRETDPDRTLALFAEGERVARSYGHPWWVMLFRQWQVHGTIYYKIDYRNLLDRAVENLLTIREPAYAAYPQRLWIPIDLIVIYQMTDARGYAEETGAAIRSVEQEEGAGVGNPRYLLQLAKINWALERESLDEVRDLTLTALSWLEAEPDRHVAGHFQGQFTAYPALLASKKRDWTELAATAEVAEEAARQRCFTSSLATALMWQAVAARDLDDRKRAGRLYRAAQAQRTKLGRPSSSWFYDAWAAYRQLADALPEVLQVRNLEYQDIRNRGMLAYECGTLTELCRLKAALGTLQPEDREAAYQAAMRLRKPQSYIAALESAVGGKSATA